MAALGALPPLLRDEPGLTRALGEPDAAPRRRRGGAADLHRCAVDTVVAASPRGQLPDGHDGRPARRRSRPVPPTRRRRALPRLGDAAVRAGQPQRGDDGAAPRHPVAAARSRTLPGDHRRRRTSTDAEARARRHGDRADHRPPGQRGRSRRTRPTPRRVRVPPRGTRRAPRRVRTSRCDRRRVPVDRRRAHPNRPLG